MVAIEYCELQRTE